MVLDEREPRMKNVQKKWEKYTYINDEMHNQIWNWCAPPLCLDAELRQ